MPEFLADGNPVATQNAYVPALTLGPASRVKRVNLSVLGANAALLQCWRYIDEAHSKSELEQVERVIAGQSIGVVLRNVAGVRVRSATVNQSTTVVAELVYEGDIEIDGGAVTSANISATGTITPPPAAAMNFQHQSVLVGTEPTVDYLDGDALWAITDDSGNSRVTVDVHVPACRARATLPQTLTTGVETVVTLGTASFDTDTMFSPSRLTFNTAGVYQLSAGVEFDASAAGYRYIYFKKNGATVVGVLNSEVAGVVFVALQEGDLEKFAVGDYVELIAFQNAGGPLNIAIARPAFLAAARVGAG